MQMAKAEEPRTLPIPKPLPRRKVCSLDACAAAGTEKAICPWFSSPSFAPQAAGRTAPCLPRLTLGGQQRSPAGARLCCSTLQRSSSRPGKRTSRNAVRALPNSTATEYAPKSKGRGRKTQKRARSAAAGNLNCKAKLQLYFKALKGYFFALFRPGAHLRPQLGSPRQQPGRTPRGRLSLGSAAAHVPRGSGTGRCLRRSAAPAPARSIFSCRRGTTRAMPAARL